MEATMIFLDCPAYLDEERTVRCGLPAEIRCRFTMRSTSGPLESAMIRCPSGHWFNGPIESLTADSSDKRPPGPAAVAASAGRDSLKDSHNGGVGAAQGFPGERDHPIPRSNCAPAYYLGRPASLWIAAMSPRRRRPTLSQLTQAATGG
jgi:hypothetical protein